MGDVLTKELVAACRAMINGTAPALGAGGVPRMVSVTELCDSHEAFRARVVELEGEVERVRAFCEVEVVAALRLQLEQSLAEVERLRGVVVESDKDLVANTARKIARDHNMPLKSAEWMMLEALRVVRSNEAANIVARCDKAIARATAAEAREAGLKAALNMMDECCWQAWKAFTEEGPNAAEKFLHDVCITEGIMNNDGGRIPRAALAATAPAKGDKP